MFYIDVILIPALVGIIFRLLFIKKEKGYLVTVFFLAAALSFAAYAVYIYTIGHSGGGNEGPGLLGLASTVTFLGACIVEAIRKLINKF